MALCLFGTYLFITAPTVFWGDGGFLISASYVLGIPHPTGHPLFSFLGKIATLLPFGNIAFRLNLFSLLLCIGSFYLAIFLTKNLIAIVSPEDSKSSELIAILAALSLSLTGMILEQANSVETYSLNLFLSLLVSCFVIAGEKFFQKNEQGAFLNSFFIAFLIIGLAYGNHSLLVMGFGIAFLIYFALRLYSIQKIRSGLLGLFFLFLGMTIYVYLPLRAYAFPTVNLGNPQNFSNFIWVFTGDEFRENTFSPSGFLTNFNIYNLVMTTKATFDTFFRHLYYFWAVFFIAGSYCLYKKNKALFGFLILVILIQIGITYPPTFNTGVPLEERGVSGYYLVPLALCFIFGGLGLKIILDWARNRCSERRFNFYKYSSLVLLIIIPFIHAYDGLNSKNHSKDYSTAIFGKSFLESSKYNGLILTISDAGLFVPLYYQSCENLRTDNTLINRSMFFNKSGYSLLREVNSKMFDHIVPARGFFDDSDFVKYIAKISRTIPVYFETGKISGFVPSSFYPDILLLGYGDKEPERLSYHWEKSEQLVELIKSQNFYAKKDAIFNFSLPIYNIGSNFLKVGDFDSSIKQYRLALGIDPLMKEAAVNLTTALAGAGKFRECIDLSNKLVKIFWDPIIYYNYGYSLIQSGEKLEAKRVLEEGIRYFGKNEKIDTLLTQLH